MNPNEKDFDAMFAKAREASDRLEAPPMLIAQVVSAVEVAAAQPPPPLPGSGVGFTLGTKLLVSMSRPACWSAVGCCSTPRRRAMTHGRAIAARTFRRHRRALRSSR